jgi:hypothetical protein
MKHLQNEQIWDYISENLDIDKIAEINSHLQKCADCQKEYKLLLLIHQDLYTVQQEVPSMGFSNAVINQLVEEQSVDKSGLFWIRFTKYAIVVSMLLAIIALLFMAAFQNEEVSFTINGKVIMTVLWGSVLLWGFYLTDRIFYNSYWKSSKP